LSVQLISVHPLPFSSPKSPHIKPQLKLLFCTTPHP
jgi:hypothetical protein